jgi:hypothetical protein
MKADLAEPPQHISTATHASTIAGFRADSVKLSSLNAAIAITVRVLDATGVYQGELLGVGVPAFVAPTLAVLALVFGWRDLPHGWRAPVVAATALTLIALWTSWWPLLEAD